jgi:hypothetical protein
VGIDPQRRAFHIRPTGIVEHDCQDRQAVLLGNRVQCCRIVEVEAAIADDLHDAAFWSCELDA